VHPELTITGLLIGILVGLTGMGGGSLMTPALVLLFGFKPTVAIGTDILHGAIFKTVGAIRHRSLGTVQARLSGWMLIGSAPMSLLGVWLATWLRDHYGDDVESVMGQVLGAALVFGGLGLVAKGLFRTNGPGAGFFAMRRRDRVAAVLIGVLGGFIVGLTSVGSGVFFGLSMLVLFPLGAAKVVGTDIFHAAALLWVAGAGHLVAGNVDVSAMSWLLAGSIPGVLIGSHFTLRIKDLYLRLAMASVLIVSGLKLIELPVAAALPIALGAAVMVIAAVVRGRRQAYAALVTEQAARPST
jgi:uncharacterized protein